jgi:radical SAM superfamily enzyme YgiQ (UPF0313 family)
MKVLFVYPWFPNTYWSFRYALSILGKRSFFPPLGLMTISAMLPKDWERRLVDMNVQPLTDADLKWADAVFLSAMHVQRESLQQVITRAKRHGKRVVVGGPYASICPELLTEADHVFVGEAENIFPQFLKDLERGEAKQLYDATERPSLTAVPIPDFSLPDLSRYKIMPLQYSRGCPFNCEFCDIIEIYGRVPRTKSNHQLLAELDALLNIGWRGTVFIVDDNFIGNKKSVKLLMPDIVRWSEEHGYPFSFLTEASVNLADDEELLHMMTRAGFNRVFVGIETPVEESLKSAQKGQNTRRDLLESINKIQRAGMEVMAGFIVGFDEDPEDIFQRQISFIRDSAVPLSFVGMLSAIPQTQLWRRLEREGRLLGFDHTGNVNDCEINFIPKMDPARLVKGYQSILRTIYNPEEYYRRSLACLARVSREDAPSLRGSGNLQSNVTGLIRIAFTLGVLDGGRSQFWRYLLRVMREHRDKLEHGLMLAVMGYHFRRLTEEYCGPCVDPVPLSAPGICVAAES